MANLEHQDPPPGTARLAGYVDDLVYICHTLADRAGWWPGDFNVGEKLALIHSEVSEALEGHRKNKMDEHLPHLPSITVELADAVIRIADLAGALKLDLGTALVEKLAYNARREDHKIENRRKAGGKAY